MDAQEVDEKTGERERAEFVAKAKLPTQFGDFEIYAFEDRKMKTHLALVRGDVKDAQEVPVRLHSRCLTGDALGSMRCDCREQYEKAIKYLGKQEKGVLLYMNQEGRGIGLANKIRAYELQDKGLDTVQANHQLGFADDLRSYESAADMLKYLQVGSVVLLSNNPKKVQGLQKEGIEVAKRMPLQIDGNEHDANYLKTKKEKMGHILDEQD
ncbi:GTP cyclohydrolase II [Candidatus Micrarchaeota archaeon CG10_big_fil_rev_8_21_14_0_10_45_29]|nr:MAG: GTP cyclohydrolase II [Candidatus Micrarchaeota archaeon CG10_big_fil_rev_8_21_14_0_10_45_29]